MVASQCPLCHKRTLIALLARPEAQQSVSRADTDGCRQYWHHTDPTHPVPAGIGKANPERIGQQDLANGDSDDPVKVSNVGLHRVSSIAVLFQTGILWRNGNAAIAPDQTAFWQNGPKHERRSPRTLQAFWR